MDGVGRAVDICPFTIVVEEMAALLNAELVEHPVYDGIEVQRFEDAVHGSGILTFLSRREDRRVDYYVDPALTLDRAGYQLGAGTGVWVETEFAKARLDVGSDGVVADIAFRDVDGRWIEIVVDDRAAGPRPAGDLLAPIGSSVDRPASLLLVLLHGFDLVRRGPDPPSIKVDGRPVGTGRLPFAFLHRRHMVKAAGPITVARVCPDRVPEGAGQHVVEAGGRVRAVQAKQGGSAAELLLEPGFPPPSSLEGQVEGTWTVTVDGSPITGGAWRARREGDRVPVSLDVTRRWSPAGPQSPLMRVVTRLLPVFRRWPTTYQWRSTVALASGGGTGGGEWTRDGAGSGAVAGTGGDSAR